MRINPGGNIGGDKPLDEDRFPGAGKEHSFAHRCQCRIHREGDPTKIWGSATPEALVESALNYVRVLEQAAFSDIIISLKASDVPTTYRAYRLMAGKVDYPFHIGITEAVRA